MGRRYDLAEIHESDTVYKWVIIDVSQKAGKGLIVDWFEKENDARACRDRLENG
jgi:hypothetical protein